MTQVCSKCSRVNPPEAAYCYDDGALLAGHSVNGGPVDPGSAAFPSQFVFPSGLACRNFDQLALACQQNWKAALDLLKQGFLTSFLGGVGRADLALAAQEAAQFPDQDRGLDQFLSRLPTQALDPPKIKAEPSDISLGQVPIGSDRHFDLHLTNLGMRLLYGSVVSDCKWLTLGEPPGNPQKLFQCGTEMVVPVQVRGQHLRAGTKPLEGKLVVESNGGAVSITVRADVPVKPFPDGVLAGSITPRQIAEKAKASPREAAALFEKGAVGEWFTANGWKYPVQGPSASGLGAVQQFFEALGLAKAPKVEISTNALVFRGKPGDTLQAALEVKTPENKYVYAHATCDQSWVEVGRAKLNGRFASINVKIPAVPDRPGETLQAKLHVMGNGSQRFIIPITVAVEGTNPFAGLATAEPSFASAPDVAATPVTLPPPVPASEAISPPPLPAATATSPPAAPPAPVSPPALAKTAFAKMPRLETPRWVHMLPLGVLALALLGIVFRDWFAPAPPMAGPDDDVTELKVGLYFDYSTNKEKIAKHKLTQTMSYGVVKLDDPLSKTYKRLTYDEFGRTNSTIFKIDGTQRHLGGLGDWESKPHDVRLGMTGTWAFRERIHVTQSASIIPGEPIEVGPGIYKRYLDTCFIRYHIDNKDKRPHKVGMRILLDTLIGDNDAPAFAIPGVAGLVEGSKDISPPQRVPDFIQALEEKDIKKPGTVAQLNLRLTDKIEAPNRVSLTRYPGGRGLMKYDIPVANIEGDSAIAMYWEEKDMPPGASRVLGFTFGLGAVSTSEGLIGLSVGGSFAPGGELSVVALVSDPQPKQTVTLELPAELSLVESPATQEVPVSQKMPSGRLRPSPVTWRIRSSVPGSFPIHVKTSTGSSQSQKLTIKTGSLF